MVTAETAVVLPVLLVVLVAGVWVLACVAAQLRCVDAARGGARAAARGDASASVLAVAARVAPDSAQVRVTRAGDEVTVHVTSYVRPLGSVLRRLPAARVTASATALVESP